MATIKMALDSFASRNPPPGRNEGAFGVEAAAAASAS